MFSFNISDIFDLISALKSGSFNENMIISMSHRGIHVLNTSKRLLKTFMSKNSLEIRSSQHITKMCSK